MQEEIIFGGLIENPEDSNDFSLGAVFDLGDIKNVPNIDFDVARDSHRRDQKNTDFCTGYAVTDASDDQEGEELSPEYQFGKTKELGKDPESWGANLRLACQSAVKFGSLPQELWDEEFGIKGRYDRDIVAYSSKFPKWWDNVAKDRKKKTFFAVVGDYDTFDNVRCALWNLKSSVVCGALWRKGWTYSEGGVINSITSESGSGHAFNLVGQKIIDGVPYIKARLSNGEKTGDKGHYYFSREIINSEFPRYGLYVFMDMDKEEARVLIDYGWKFNFITSIIAKLIAFINKIIK